MRRIIPQSANLCQPDSSQDIDRVILATPQDVPTPHRIAPRRQRFYRGSLFYIWYTPAPERNSAVLHAYLEASGKSLKVI